jgi:serine/threonine-protein kinase
MELVEGPTLADRIARGPIPVDEALGIATQIAAALEAAHAQGIVHRDLKPANVKVRPDGTVKVLDFGIAKALETRAISGPGTPLTTPAVTEVGMLLGTAAYMAPEQARGKAVDERADIWAFGAVLYEMLTGQPAFGGEDVTVTLARVLERPTDFGLLPKTVSVGVRRTLELCLEKDPRWRIADIRDVRLALAGRFETSVAQLAPTHTAAGPRRSVWPLVAAILFGGALVGLAGLSIWPETEPRAVKRFALSLPPGQSFAGADFHLLDLSSDGTTLVYSTVDGLRLRDLTTLEDRAIPSTEQATFEPTFSPDGESIAYLANGVNLRKIPTRGGPVAQATDRPIGGPIAMMWAPDGTLLFSENGGIRRVPAGFGPPELIVEAGGAILLGAELLPDGDTVLFTRLTTSASHGEVYVQSISTGERTPVVDDAADARYVPTGHIVYAVDDTLVGIAFDIATKRTRGSGVPLFRGVSRSVGSGARAQYAIANDGTLAYARGIGGTERTLVWVDRSGGETSIAAPPRNYQYLDLSPDETRVVLDIRDQANDTWLLDLERGVLQRRTFDPGQNRGAVFSPDGRRIVFSRQIDETEEIYWQAADGTGSPEALTRGSGMPLFPNEITADGTLLYTTSIVPRDFFMIPVAGPAGPGTPLLAAPTSEGHPTVSPNGRWVAYASDESGAFEIYVRPFPDVGAGHWQVSTARGGFHAHWSPDGSELFYLEVRDNAVAMLAVPVDTGEVFRHGVPTELFTGPYFYGSENAAPDVYDVSADGRFLMIKQFEAPDEKQTPEIVIVENWFEELKRLVPTD